MDGWRDGGMSSRLSSDVYIFELLQQPDHKGKKISDQQAKSEYYIATQCSKDYTQLLLL